MIKAILIDIDNTLLDFDAYVQNTMRAGFEFFRLGEYRDSMFDTFTEINNGLWQQIERGDLTFVELQSIRWNRILSALEISFDGCVFEQYFRKALFNSAIPVRGAVEILSYLSGKYPVCAASNGPYEQQINRLRCGKMHDYFTDFFISERVGFSKPSAEFFNHCLDELNRSCDSDDSILPEEVIMIGDSVSSDMAGAIGFGMKTCYFDKKQKGAKPDLPIDHNIRSLRQLKEIL